jgi:type IV secretory pathway VirB2 component (pilin)
VIAVLIIVISGIQISAAGGDQTTVTNAKNRIVQSLGGLVILFLSAIILYTINPTFFTK